MAQLLFIALALLSLTPLVSAGAALVGGMVFTLLLGNPYLRLSHRLSEICLALSISGIGAGMNLTTVWHYGVGSAGYTAIEIALSMCLGLFLGKLLRTERNPSLLVTSGVSVCGASAIAVIALTIRGKPYEISLALAIIYLLNAVGIIFLPRIGHLFHLTQVQFGLWSALSITDTSSVVGAAMSYGSLAVQVGTNAKLARALWIVPLAFILRRGSAPPSRTTDAAVKRRFPWFIVAFLILAALYTWLPALRSAGHLVESAAKRLLVLTLFLMGSTLTRESLRRIGARPLVQGFALWLVVTVATFGAIEIGWIR